MVKKLLSTTLIISLFAVPMLVSAVSVKTNRGYEYQSNAYVTSSSSGKQVTGVAECYQYHDYITRVGSKSGYNATVTARWRATNAYLANPSQKVYVTNSAFDGSWAYHELSR
ncbi:MAG: hypothetical protein ACRC7N_08945 [Clostridium sp.]